MHVNVFIYYINAIVKNSHSAPLKRNYELELRKTDVPSAQVKHHPLENIKTNTSFNPLAAIKKGETILPFIEAKIEPKKEKEEEPWPLFKHKITNYTDEFLEEDEPMQIGEDISKEIKLAKGSKKLAELEKKDGELLYTTKNEYRSEMLKVISAMQKYWGVKDKVMCIKIAIQCAKLLNTIEVPMFYPEKFVQICEIFDLLSEFAHNRIIDIAFNPDKKPDFDPKSIKTVNSGSIPDIAKEICNNWILKVSCIRELVPRMYGFY